jgi:hypothetical protein
MCSLIFHGLDAHEISMSNDRISRFVRGGATNLQSADTFAQISSRPAREIAANLEQRRAYFRVRGVRE